jgi:hypothetical protein
MNCEKCVQQPSPSSPNRPDLKKKISLLRDLNYFVSIITNAHDSVNTFRVYLRKNDSMIVSFPMLLMILSAPLDWKCFMAMKDSSLHIVTSLSVSAS